MSLRDQIALFGARPAAGGYSGLFVDRTGRSLPAMARCVEVLGPLVAGEAFHAVSGGEWSFEHALAWAVDQIGPCRIRLATWIASEQPVTRLLAAMDAGLVTDLRGAVDWHTKTQRRTAYDLLRRRIPTRRPDGLRGFRDGDFHAKSAFLDAPGWTVAIVGSANLNDNPRAETYSVTTDAETFAAHAAWFDAYMEEG